MCMGDSWQGVDYSGFVMYQLVLDELYFPEFPSLYISSYSGHTRQFNTIFVG